MPTKEADEFNGKRTVVTGGTRGIGEAIVNRLLGGGAKVLTTARSLPAGAARSSSPRQPRIPSAAASTWRSPARIPASRPRAESGPGDSFRKMRWSPWTPSCASA